MSFGNWSNAATGEKALSFATMSLNKRMHRPQAETHIFTSATELTSRLSTKTAPLWLTEAECNSLHRHPIYLLVGI